MDPLSSSSTITISHESFGENYHATFRSGQYACMFDNFYRSSRNMRVVDLESSKNLRTFKCEVDESILAFGYPYIVTRIGGKLKIWDVNSPLADPKVIHTDLTDIRRGAIQGKTIVIISTQYDTMQPKYITIIRDFEDQNTRRGLIDDTIDGSSGLVIYKDYVVYSTYFGALRLLSLDDPTGDPKMLSTAGDVKSYIDKVWTENVEEFKKNIAQSIVSEGETLAYSTQCAIKVWNVNSDKLQKEINTKKNYTLLSLEGRFILGVTDNSAKIWDLFTGNIIYKEKGKDAFPSAGNIPSFTLYNNKIYHVGKSKERKDIIIPQDEKPITEEKDSNPDKEQQEPKKERCLLS
jgi:WD40 repeat protein